MAFAILAFLKDLEKYYRIMVIDNSNEIGFRILDRQMDIRVLWDDDQIVWHSPPYTSASSSVTADEDDDLDEPLRHQMFKMLVRQSECRYGTRVKSDFLVFCCF